MANEHASRRNIEYVVNAVGRRVPTMVNGVPKRPFAGPFAGHGGGPKHGPRIPAPGSGKGRIDKVVSGGLDALFETLPLRDGMVVSFHHHLRNGDILVNEVVARLARRGVKDVVLAPSALFPVHDKIIPFIEDGTISHVEGSMNGAVGRACTLGKMRRLATLRSHGGRFRAIQDGDLRIDVAFLAAPAADAFGNATGVLGKSACGPLGFGLADSLYADRVVIVTDNLVPFPCVPFSIQGGNVDHVVVVDSIGDPAKIVSGTTQITKSPTQLLIAEYAARFVEETGYLKEGFSFQGGAGGISLAFTVKLAELMRRRKITAGFARGGSTEILVNLLREGLVKYILDGQSFDASTVASMRDDKRHVETNPFVSYNYHAKGCFAHMVDVGVLGATECDLDFNVNVNTHSDGWLLHGIGGFTDVAAGAGLTIITAPSFRKRIPIIRERVTTVTCPGEVIDVIVTERGIAVNPRRTDLLERLKGTTLPIKPIERIMEEVQAITGVPETPEFLDEPVAVIEWRDGTLIDTVWKLKE